MNPMINPDIALTLQNSSQYSDTKEKPEQPEQSDPFMEEMERRRCQKNAEKTFFELRAERRRLRRKYYRKLREKEQLEAKKEQEVLQKEFYKKGVAQLERIRGSEKRMEDVRIKESSYILDKSSFVKKLV